MCAWWLRVGGLTPSDGPRLLVGRLSVGDLGRRLMFLLGALVVAYGDYYLLPSVLVAMAGSAVAILLRLAAMRWDWNLPPVAPK